MTYREIPIVEIRPDWLIAFSMPLREVVSSDDDNEMCFEIIRKHFEKRGAIPDVAAHYGGRLYVGAQ